MIVKKSRPPSSFNGKSYKTKYLWCADGWMYDTTSMHRCKFFPVDKDLKIVKEPFTRQVFNVEYSEDIEVTIISEKPKIWIEKGIDTQDMFEEITSRVC